VQESIGEESNKIGQLATDPENLWVQNAKGLQKKIFRTNFKRSRFVMQQDQRANNNMISETGSENSRIKKKQFQKEASSESSRLKKQ
jgi:hypothetical protein